MAKNKNTNNFAVLFTCIGRRVSLLSSFRQATGQLKPKADIKMLGTDTTELSPAFQMCNKAFVVRHTSDPGYIKQLLDIVRKNNVRLIVPTVDLDLKVLAENKNKFYKSGCVVLVSSPHVIDICRDKRKTFRFLVKNGFDTPLTMSTKTALAKKNLNCPCFIKPWDGHASRGTAAVENRKELLFYAKKIPNPIVQEYINGTEYTCDVYVDFNMKVRCVVPRKRIQVRSGEVSKGQVIKDPKIIEQAAKVVEKLQAGPGVITLQLFLTDDDTIKFIELNPRFGGGVPLSIKAGANFPKWILQELTGRTPTIKTQNIRDGLIMLRYDDEVWIDPKK